MKLSFSQISEDLLREVFSKCGVLQELIVFSGLRCAMLCYQSADSIIQVKNCLDGNPHYFGINLEVEFVYKSDFDMILKRSGERTVRNCQLNTAHCSTHTTSKDSFSFSLSTPPLPPSAPLSPILPTSGRDITERDLSPFSTQSCEGMPNSSVWSNCDLLSGVSLTWLGAHAVTSSASNNLYPLESAQSVGESVSSFLPNGLLQ